MAPSTASSQKWFPVATTTNVTTNGYRNQTTFRTRHLTSRASGQPSMRANATCIDGTAAKGLKSALTVTLSCGTPVKFETESVKPHSGKKRGGAAGNAM